MFSYFRCSTFALIFAALSTASAEAYCSRAAPRTNHWNSRQQHAGSAVNQPPPRHEVNVPFSDYPQHGVATELRAGAKSASTDEKPFWNKQLFRELFAEMLGTCMIVGLGTGAVMSAIYTSSLVGLFQVASVWIIAVTLAIATTGPVSGAQLNPAISLAFAWLRPSKSFGWSKVIPYSVAQLVGAVLASFGNLLMYWNKIKQYEKLNQIARGTAESIASAKAFGQYFESLPANTMGMMTAFSAEALGTAILAFVVFALTNEKNDASKNTMFIPPLIGCTVGALIAGIAPITQAGFNPARDFGPRIVAWLAGWKGVALQGWWIYAIAPLVGAPIGAFVADKLLYGNDDE